MLTTSNVYPRPGININITNNQDSGSGSGSSGSPNVIVKGYATESYVQEEIKKAIEDHVSDVSHGGSSGGEGSAECGCDMSLYAPKSALNDYVLKATANDKYASKSSIEGVNSNVSTLSNSVQSLSSQVYDATSTIEEHTSQIGTLESQVSTLESKVDKLPSGSGSGSSCNCDLTQYLKKSDASSTYVTKTDANSTYLTSSNASSTYLTKTDASNTYAVKPSGTDTYVTKTDANNTYATISALEEISKQTGACICESKNYVTKTVLAETITPLVENLTRETTNPWDVDCQLYDDIQTHDVLTLTSGDTSWTLDPFIVSRGDYMRVNDVEKYYVDHYNEIVISATCKFQLETTDEATVLSLMEGSSLDTSKTYKFIYHPNRKPKYALKSEVEELTQGQTISLKIVEQTDRDTMMQYQKDKVSYTAGGRQLMIYQTEARHKGTFTITDSNNTVYEIAYSDISTDETTSVFPDKTNTICIADMSFEEEHRLISGAVYMYDSENKVALLESPLSITISKISLHYSHLVTQADLHDQLSSLDEKYATKDEISLEKRLEIAVLTEEDMEEAIEKRMSCCVMNYIHVFEMAAADSGKFIITDTNNKVYEISYKTGDIKDSSEASYTSLPDTTETICLFAPCVDNAQNMIWCSLFDYDSSKQEAVINSDPTIVISKVELVYTKDVSTYTKLEIDKKLKSIFSDNVRFEQDVSVNGVVYGSSTDNYQSFNYTQTTTAVWDKQPVVNDVLRYRDSGNYVLESDLHGCRATIPKEDIGADEDITFVFSSNERSDGKYDVTVTITGNPTETVNLYHRMRYIMEDELIPLSNRISDVTQHCDSLQSALYLKDKADYSQEDYSYTFQCTVAEPDAENKQLITLVANKSLLNTQVYLFPSYANGWTPFMVNELTTTSNPSYDDTSFTLSYTVTIKNNNKATSCNVSVHSLQYIYGTPKFVTKDEISLEKRLQIKTGSDNAEADIENKVSCCIESYIYVFETAATYSGKFIITDTNDKVYEISYKNSDIQPSWNTGDVYVLPDTTSTICIVGPYMDDSCLVIPLHDYDSTKQEPKLSDDFSITVSKVELVYKRDLSSLTQQFVTKDDLDELDVGMREVNYIIVPIVSEAEFPNYQLDRRTVCCGAYIYVFEPAALEGGTINIRTLVNLIFEIPYEKIDQANSIYAYDTSNTICAEIKRETKNDESHMLVILYDNVAGKEPDDLEGFSHRIEDVYINTVSSVSVSQFMTKEEIYQKDYLIYDTEPDTSYTLTTKVDAPANKKQIVTITSDKSLKDTKVRYTLTREDETTSTGLVYTGYGMGSPTYDDAEHKLTLTFAAEEGTSPIKSVTASVYNGMSVLSSRTMFPTYDVVAEVVDTVTQQLNSKVSMNSLYFEDYERTSSVEVYDGTFNDKEYSFTFYVSWAKGYDFIVDGTYTFSKEGSNNTQDVRFYYNVDNNGIKDLGSTDGVTYDYKKSDDSCEINAKVTLDDNYTTTKGTIASYVKKPCNPKFVFSDDLFTTTKSAATADFTLPTSTSGVAYVDPSNSHIFLTKDHLEGQYLHISYEQQTGENEKTSGTDEFTWKHIDHISMLKGQSVTGTNSGKLTCVVARTSIKDTAEFVFTPADASKPLVHASTVVKTRPVTYETLIKQDLLPGDISSDKIIDPEDDKSYLQMKNGSAYLNGDEIATKLDVYQPEYVYDIKDDSYEITLQRGGSGGISPFITLSSDKSLENVKIVAELVSDYDEAILTIDPHSLLLTTDHVWQRVQSYSYDKSTNIWTVSLSSHNYSQLSSYSVYHRRQSIGDIPKFAMATYEEKSETTDSTFTIPIATSDEQKKGTFIDNNTNYITLQKAHLEGGKLDLYKESTKYAIYIWGRISDIAGEANKTISEEGIEETLVCVEPYTDAKGYCVVKLMKGDSLAALDGYTLCTYPVTTTTWTESTITADHLMVGDKEVATEEYVDEKLGDISSDRITDPEDDKSFLQMKDGSAYLNGTEIATKLDVYSTETEWVLDDSITLSLTDIQTGGPNARCTISGSKSLIGLRIQLTCKYQCGNNVGTQSFDIVIKDESDLTIIVSTVPSVGTSIASVWLADGKVYVLHQRLTTTPKFATKEELEAAKPMRLDMRETADGDLLGSIYAAVNDGVTIKAEGTNSCINLEASKVCVNDKEVATKLDVYRPEYVRDIQDDSYEITHSVGYSGALVVTFQSNKSLYDTELVFTFPDGNGSECSYDIQMPKGDTITITITGSISEAWVDAIEYDDESKKLTFERELSGDYDSAVPPTTSSYKVFKLKRNITTTPKFAPIVYEEYDSTMPLNADVSIKTYGSRLRVMNNERFGSLETGNVYLDRLYIKGSSSNVMLNAGTDKSLTVSAPITAPNICSSHHDRITTLMPGLFPYSSVQSSEAVTMTSGSDYIQFNFGHYYIQDNAPGESLTITVTLTPKTSGDTVSYNFVIKRNADVHTVGYTVEYDTSKFYQAKMSGSGMWLTIRTNTLNLSDYTVTYEPFTFSGYKGIATQSDINSAKTDMIQQYADLNARIMGHFATETATGENDDGTYIETRNIQKISSRREYKSAEGITTKTEEVVWNMSTGSDGRLNIGTANGTFMYMHPETGVYIPKFESGFALYRNGERRGYIYTEDDNIMLDPNSHAVIRNIQAYGPRGLEIHPDTRQSATAGYSILKQYYNSSSTDNCYLGLSMNGQTQTDPPVRFYYNGDVSFAGMIMGAGIDAGDIHCTGLSSSGPIKSTSYCQPRYLELPNEGNSGDDYIRLFQSNGTLVARRVTSSGNIDKTLWNGTSTSQTITHATNVSGEIGTFCESTGKIYDGYPEITNTDCICQVTQSTELNAKIVGIIVDEERFASHGDVLVKVVDGTYQIGDILTVAPDGRGMVADDSAKFFMVCNGIPLPKVTSLATGMDNVVACFLA